MQSDFAGWLRKGLGRAALSLKNNPGGLYRDDLLYACTHNLCYDRLFEERAPYLTELIELSGDSTFYRGGVLAALRDHPDDDDLGQIFEVAGSFVRKGDDLMLEAMYAAFERIGYARAGLTCADELVKLDGPRAFLFLTRTFGEEDPDERPWQFRHLLTTLEEHHGKHELPSGLEHFWAECQEYNATRTRPSRPTYEQMKLEIQSNQPKHWHLWAGRASAQEAELAARDLLAETDSDRLLRFLQIFRRCAFPLAPDRLLELARSADDQISRAAMRALSKLSHPEIRALGLVTAKRSGFYGLAVEMLVHNAEPADYRLIESLIEVEQDPDELDHLGRAARDFNEANRSPEAVKALLALYEKGPCSLCRYSVVKELIGLGALPIHLRDECRYDSYSCTRELVNGATPQARARVRPCPCLTPADTPPSTPHSHRAAASRPPRNGCTPPHVSTLRDQLRGNTRSPRSAPPASPLPGCRNRIGASSRTFL